MEKDFLNSSFNYYDVQKTITLFTNPPKQVFLKNLDLQFFSEKKDADDIKVEESEKELQEDISDAVIEKEKQKHEEKKETAKKEEAPAWMKSFVQEIKEAIAPTTETAKAAEIPVPKAPPAPKEEEKTIVEEVVPQDSPLKKALKFLW